MSTGSPGAQIPKGAYLVSSLPPEFDKNGNPVTYTIQGIHAVKSIFTLETLSFIPTIWKNSVLADKQWPVLPLDFVAPEGGENISGLAYVGAKEITPIKTASVSISRAGIVAIVTHTAHSLSTGATVTISGITDKTEDNAAHVITKISDNSYSYPTTNTGSVLYTGSIISTYTLPNTAVKTAIFATVTANVCTGTEDNGKTVKTLSTLVQGVDYPSFSSGGGSSSVSGGPSANFIIVRQTGLVSSNWTGSSAVKKPYVICAPPTTNVSSIVWTGGTTFLLSCTMTLYMITYATGYGADTWPDCKVILLCPFDNLNAFPTATSRYQEVGTWSLTKGYVNQHGKINYIFGPSVYNPVDPGAFFDLALSGLNSVMLTNNKRPGTIKNQAITAMGQSTIEASLIVRGTLNEAKGQIEITGVHKVNGYSVINSNLVELVTFDHTDNGYSVASPYPSFAPKVLWATSGPDDCGSITCPVERGSRTMDYEGFTGSPDQPVGNTPTLYYYSELAGEENRLNLTRTLVASFGQGVLIATCSYTKAINNDRSIFDRTGVIWNPQGGTTAVLDYDPNEACGVYFPSYKAVLDPSTSNTPITCKNARITDINGGGAAVESKTQYSLDNGATWVDYTFGGTSYIKIGGGRAIFMHSQEKRLYLFDRGEFTLITFSGCLADGKGSAYQLVAGPMTTDQFIFVMEYTEYDRPVNASASLVADASGVIVVLNSATQISIINEGLITAITGVAVTYSNANTYTFTSATISGFEQNIITLATPLNTTGIVSITVTYTRTAPAYRLILLTKLFSTKTTTHVKWEDAPHSYVVGTHAGGGLDPTYDMSYPYEPVVSPGALQLTEKTFANIDISVHTVFNDYISYTGGVPPVSTFLVSGSLPPGLALSEIAIISGTLNLAQIAIDMGETGTVTYTFEVRATDGQGTAAANREYTITCVT